MDAPCAAQTLYIHAAPAFKRGQTSTLWTAFTMDRTRGSRRLGYIDTLLSLVKCGDDETFHAAKVAYLTKPGSTAAPSLSTVRAPGPPLVDLSLCTPRCA